MKRILALLPLLLASALSAQANSPVQHEPVRNTFAVASESILDHAALIDLHAPTAAYDPDWANLKTARANLETLADSEREHDLAAAIDDLLFAISSCRIQAIDSADTAPCEKRVDRNRARAIELLGRHKQGNVWVDGK